MANNIQYSTVFLPLLDKVYKQDAKTSILEGDETTVQKGKNGEIKIAKLDMDALGDFSRSSGYTSGSTTLVWEAIKYDKERSQKLKIDRLDNDEAVVDAFANLSSEFVRTKVIPETDAARIAKIAKTAIGASNGKSEDLTTAAQVIAALRASTNAMDEAEVPVESRILFITPTHRSLLDDMDTYKSKAVLDRFSDIIIVPQSRMYTGVTLNSGKTKYGYEQETGSYAINFLVVEKSAAVCAMDQYIKYFSPDEDQEGDNHILAYRNYNLYGYVYENKTAGVYCSYGKTAKS